MEELYRKTFQMIIQILGLFQRQSINVIIQNLIQGLMQRA